MLYCTRLALTISSFRRFFMISNFGGIQDGGQYGRHLGWRHRPPAVPQPIIYTSSCREHQRLSAKGKISPKYWNTAKTQGRGSIPPLQEPMTHALPPLYHGGGVTLLVRPRANCYLSHFQCKTASHEGASDLGLDRRDGFKWRGQSSLRGRHGKGRERGRNYSRARRKREEGRGRKSCRPSSPIL